MTLRSFYTKLQKISLTFRMGMVGFDLQKDVTRLQLYWPYFNYMSYKGDFYASAKTVFRFCRRPIEGFWCFAIAVAGFGFGIERVLPSRKWKCEYNMSLYGSSPFYSEFEAPNEKMAAKKAMLVAKENSRSYGVPQDGEQQILNLKVQPLEQWKIDWDNKQNAAGARTST